MLVDGAGKWGTCDGDGTQLGWFITIENDETIDQVEVTTSIRGFLDSIGQGKNFGVISKSETIFIKSINGEKMPGQAKSVHSIRSCCGL